MLMCRLVTSWQRADGGSELSVCIAAALCSRTAHVCMDSQHEPPSKCLRLSAGAHAGDSAVGPHALGALSRGFNAVYVQPILAHDACLLHVAAAAVGMNVSCSW